MRGNVVTCVAAVTAVFASAAGAGHVTAPSWSVRALGPTLTLWSGDGGFYVNQRDLLIDGHGDVAGDITDAKGDHARPFLWVNGHLTVLASLGRHDDARPTALDDRGDLVGMWSPGGSGRPNHAWAWRNGRLRELGAIPIEDPDVALNAAGVAAGTAVTAGGWSHAATWSNGRGRDLGTARGGAESGATAIDDAGRVVGWTDVGTRTDFNHRLAFLWDNGSMQTLGTLPGETGSRAVDINGRGQIIGETLGRNDDDGVFLWQNGAMTRIAPTASVAWYFEPVEVDERGDVVLNASDEWVVWRAGHVIHRGVGEAMDVSPMGNVAITDFDGHPTVWQNGVNSRLPLLPGDDTGGALAVNDDGQAAGFSCTSGSDTSHELSDYWFNCRVVLWTRTPRR